MKKRIEQGSAPVVRIIAVGWGEESFEVNPKSEGEREGFGLGSSSRVYPSDERED